MNALRRTVVRWMAGLVVRERTAQRWSCRFLLGFRLPVEYIQRLARPSGLFPIRFCIPSTRSVYEHFLHPRQTSRLYAD
jgi:hypothetical protein